MSRGRHARDCSQHLVLRMAGTLLSLMLVLVLAGQDPVIAQSPSTSDPPNASTKSTESPWLSLNYTGGLFGYYRIEPDSADPRHSWGKLHPPTKFLQQRHQDPLLLGMGDNFGPEFGASVERELGDKDACFLQADKPSLGHKNDAPEVLYKTSKRLPKMAECDNVGRFLMQAGYRAIVPGREDFLYSALWLRRMALSLQGASSPANHSHRFPEEQVGAKHDFAAGSALIGNSDHKLLMLAANLRWNFTPQGNVQGSDDSSWFPKDKFAQKVKEACPLMFTWDSPKQGLATCVPGGERGNTVTTEMDWLRRLDLTVEPSSPECELNTDPDNCFPLARSLNLRARSDVTFRRQMLENQAKIALATLSDEIEKIIGEQASSELECILGGLSSDTAFDDLMGKEPQLKLKLEAESDALVGMSDPELSPIAKDLNLILTDLRDSLKKASQNDVNFLLSLNARKAAIRLLLRRIATEQRDIGYTIVNNGSMAQTLVIGVIGQETMKAVSPVNLKVCTEFRKGQVKDFSCEDGGSAPKLEGTVAVGDPLLAVTTVLRAASVLKSQGDQRDKFERVVVMAQMPVTEAEELAAHAAVSLRKSACSDVDTPTSVGSVACPGGNTSDAPHIDLILSEAQKAHSTPGLEVTYAQTDLVPVIAPNPAWYINRAGTGLIDAVSRVTITGGQLDDGAKRTLLNVNRQTPAKAQAGPPKLPEMAELLHDELKQVALQRPSADLSNLENFWNGCQQQKACQDSVVTQYLLGQLHRSSHADVVFLEFRDLYFGPMLGGYGDYKVCEEWVKDHEKELKDQKGSALYCRLRVALDRILWKGDYSERVMVDGKNLQQMLTIAQQEAQNEQMLLARDTVDEWLMTFGVVTQLPQNLSAASMGPATFAIPGVSFCTDPGANTAASKYCINGQRVTDDGAYLVATSDHLAQDNQVYMVLQNLDAKYHIRKKKLFLTREIADEIVHHDPEEASERLVRAPDAELGMRKIEELQQKRPILQIDSAKVVAGFMLRSPNKSNTQLASDFSGVTDSRATTPSAQELDLEAVTRATTGVGVDKLSQRLRIGIQSDLEYDRAVTGSLTGSPPTVTYALNSLTAGGFLQFRMHGNLLPRWLLVVAPYQYQTQITGNFLNFRLATGSGQITVPTPRWEGFSDRLGARYEFGGRWADSYAEGGPEYSSINNVLSGLILPNGSECPASATVPLATCVASKITVTPSTVITPQTETLHTGGLYWDVHLQWALDKDKRWSTTFDTKGDGFIWPGATLPTQSRYAFTTTEAFNFRVVGNLQFAPSYKQFFYMNQGPGSHSLVTQTFSVTAKWYFARDAAIPFWRQFWFRGPASLDQTKSAKMQ